MLLVKELWRMLVKFWCSIHVMQEFHQKSRTQNFCGACILSDPLIVFKQTNGLRQKEKVKNLEVKFYNQGVQ